MPDHYQKELLPEDLSLAMDVSFLTIPGVDTLLQHSADNLRYGRTVGNSTVSTMTFGDDQKEYLVPTIYNGQRLSPDEAISRARQSMAKGVVFPTAPAGQHDKLDKLSKQISKYIGNNPPKGYVRTPTALGGFQPKRPLGLPELKDFALSYGVATPMGLAGDAQELANVLGMAAPQNFLTSRELREKLGVRENLASLVGEVLSPLPTEAVTAAKAAVPAAKSLADALLSPQLAGILFTGSPYSRYLKVPKGTMTDNIYDLFDLKHIGSGEGAQAYGWGLYFAESPGVAGGYRDTLSAGNKVTYTGFDEVPINVQKILDEPLPETWGENELINTLMQDGKKAEADWLFERMYELDTKPIKGHLYEVDIPDETISAMLDWDAPLSEQPEQLQKLIDAGLLTKNDEFSRVFGGDRFTTRKGTLIDPKKAGGGKSIMLDGLQSEELSRALNEAGIPGIRYYDAQSRVTGRPRKAIIKSFLDELPEDAEFDDLAELVGTGHFTKEQDAVLRALEKDDWLGFDYPSQAINEAFGPNLKNWEPSAELTKAIKDVVEPDATRNIVVFNPEDIKSVKRDGELVYKSVKPASGAVNTAKTVSSTLDFEISTQQYVVEQMEQELQDRIKHGDATKTVEKNLQTQKNKLKKLLHKR